MCLRSTCCWTRWQLTNALSFCKINKLLQWLSCTQSTTAELTKPCLPATAAKRRWTSQMAKMKLGSIEKSEARKLDKASKLLALISHSNEMVTFVLCVLFIAHRDSHLPAHKAHRNRHTSMGHWGRTQNKTNKASHTLQHTPAMSSA